ncbi:hypothetical protein BBB56_07720 [Candidatus Pantoea deserta]|uniref:Uncharacterized protein n=1 Tax=Candidatus Pantoea deserta TaxID=1869313 RepID=A0A3N4PBW9_9GAMM|nr:hypothetical protein BBB56_07720 [Pantoea deserta]
MQAAASTPAIITHFGVTLGNNEVTSDLNKSRRLKKTAVKPYNLIFSASAMASAARIFFADRFGVEEYS